MLSNDEVSQLAQAYFHDEVWIGSGASQEPSGAWEKLIALVDDDPRAAWAVILETLSLCTTLIEVSRIGSGVLETLLSNHADGMLPDVLGVARENPRVRQALRYATAADLTPEQMGDVNAALAAASDVK